MKKVVLWSVLVAGAAFSQLSAAAYQPGDPEYDFWAQFYDAEKNHPAQAESYLLKLAELTPAKPEVWKSLTYLRLREGRKPEALDALRKARALQPGDEQLALQEAYLLNDLGRNEESLAAFEKLAKSSDAKVAATACQAIVNIRPLLTRQLKAPYFADVYASPSYESRFDDVVVPLKLRAGRYFGPDNRGQAYGFVSANRDSQSKGGARPEIFDENAAVVGVGANYRPFARVPVLAYLEVGGSYDLIDRGRSRFRESVVAGLTGFQEWGDTSSYCGDRCETPFTPYADLYGNVATYSREDYNVLADLRLRFGLNLVKSPAGRLQGYLKLHGVNDTDRVFYNNIIEYGPGLAWHFPTSFPLVLRVESLSGQYLSGAGTPGAKDNYHNNRVELTFYKSF